MSEINPIAEIMRQELYSWHGETMLEPCKYPISRDRVVCYITRNRKEILVFQHEPKYSDAGVQVVAGGINAGESIERAAIREVLEESGLALLTPIPLGNAVMHRFMDKIGDDYQRWHFVWLRQTMRRMLGSTRFQVAKRILAWSSFSVLSHSSITVWTSKWTR